MRLSFAALFAMGLVASGASAASATTWNYASDFVAASPQSGNGTGEAWFYFYADPADRDGVYTPFSQISGLFGGAYVHSSNAFQSATSAFVHPGSFLGSEVDEDVIVGFRAPAGRTYHVSGLFADADGTDNVGPSDFRGVLAEITTTASPNAAGSDQPVAQFAPALLDASNTNEAMRGLFGGADPLPAAAFFDFSLALQTGQFLFFRVNDLGLNYFDATALAITIDDGTPVAEPAAAGILVCGLLGFALLRRRGRIRYG